MEKIMKKENERTEAVLRSIEDPNDIGLTLLGDKKIFERKKTKMLGEVITRSTSLMALVSEMKPEEKLVLDMSEEMFTKIRSGEYKLMQTKMGDLKATLLDPQNKDRIVKNLNVKYETRLPDLIDISNIVQMQAIQGQLESIAEQLGEISNAMQGVLAGQQNDRVALYNSGEQLYREALATKDFHLKRQLLVQSLKSLEEARMKMIESIKIDIQDIIDYDNKEKKLKGKEIDRKVENIDRGFDVINKASILKAGIYYEQNEQDAMMQTLSIYSDFLSEYIIENGELLNSYDRRDKELNGKWYQRAKNIPEQVKELLQSGNHTEKLEIDHETLLKIGVIRNE